MVMPIKCPQNKYISVFTYNCYKKMLLHFLLKLITQRMHLDMLPRNTKAILKIFCVGKPKVTASPLTVKVQMPETTFKKKH